MYVRVYVNMYSTLLTDILVTFRMIVSLEMVSRIASLVVKRPWKKQHLGTLAWFSLDRFFAFVYSRVTCTHNTHVKDERNSKFKVCQRIPLALFLFYATCQLTHRRTYVPLHVDLWAVRFSLKRRRKRNLGGRKNTGGAVERRLNRLIRGCYLFFSVG